MSLRRVFFVLCVLGLPPYGAPATAQDNVDIQLWTQAIAVVNVSDNWRLHIEGQPRWHNNITQTFQILTRTAAGRRVHDRLTLWAGHAWIAKPGTGGIAHEQRLWQQASITLGTKGWAPTLRVRQEQRWQGEWGDSSHRTRVMGRVVSAPAPARWAAVFWNELMLTLDETPQGPARGFDQNRVFGGALYRLSRRHWIEFGGVWVTSQPSGVRRDDYVPFGVLNLTY